MKKLRVGVIYGGRSGEHEVSVASAAAVFKNLPRSLYEPVAIRIDKDGRWSLPDRPPVALAASEVIEQSRLATAHPVRPGREAHLVAYPAEDTVLTIDRRKAAKGEAEESARVTGLGLDVVFPVLHGPHGEDGTVQGLLELSNVPYVGAGVLASAVGMDKAFMKVAFAAHGLPMADYKVFLFGDWTTHRDKSIAAIEELGYPVFVKPANLGSSVGISKAKTRDDLVTAMDLAFEYDRKVVIEAAVPAARELEVGVLGNDAPEASVAGEIIPGREFYDYEAKYLDGGSTTRVPADLDPAMHAEVKRLAVDAFKAIDCAGMARVDFLLSKETGRLYVNEINTIPGFTTISMYSQLWAASGVDYPALLDRLIKLAIERHAEKQRLKTSAS